MIWTIRRDPYYGLTAEASIGEHINIVRMKSPSGTRYICTYAKGGLHCSTTTENFKDVEQFVRGYTSENTLPQSGTQG